MKQYKHIFFDLDHTLWDYDKNTNETICDLYAMYQLEKFNLFSPEEFIKAFFEVNNELWRKFNFGQIEQAAMRRSRFNLIFNKLGLHNGDVPLGIEDKFLQTCPTKPHLLPHALAALDYLHKKYTLHIITNGFDDVQFTKLKSAGIDRHFREVITSDNSGYRKPDREIFEHAMKKAGASRSDAIFVGDNPDTDVAGAINAEMDFVYYNPARLPHGLKVLYEIDSLDRLPEMF